jgi:hypothetical protein
MVHRLAAALVMFSVTAAFAQQSLPPPTPLYQGSPPRSIEAETLPPLTPAPERAAPRSTVATPAPAPAPVPPPALSAPAAAGPAAERVFCDQTVTVSSIDPAVIPASYRQFVGIWSDAAWTAQLCAALIVENVQPDGTAALVYVFGPMGSNTRRPGGVLHGTGIIRDGELRFQNSDGSQYAFRPLYGDLDGRLTLPQGQSYQAVFKKTL